MTRTGSSKDDALTQEELEQLLDACERSSKPLLNRFLVLVMSVLGLRRGEVVHMKEGWVDFDKGVIQIPAHEPCDCGLCKAQAKQMTEHRDIPFEEAFQKFWRPKSEAGKRGIYFRNRPEIARIIEKVMSEHGECPIGYSPVNNHISKLAEMAGLEDVYPHALRATAALKYAYDGLNVFQLMSIMGWASMEVALKYIRASGAGARKALEETYSSESPPMVSSRFFGPTDLTRRLREKGLI